MQVGVSDIFVFHVQTQTRGEEGSAWWSSPTKKASDDGPFYFFFSNAFFLDFPFDTTKNNHQKRMHKNHQKTQQKAHNDGFAKTNKKTE